MTQLTTADREEELAVYDANDNVVIRYFNRSGIHNIRLPHRHVAYYVTDSSKRLLVELRSRRKKYNPGIWDKPGGHTLRDESYNGREFLEECCVGLANVPILVAPEDFESACASLNLRHTIVLARLLHQPNYDTERISHGGSEVMEKVHLMSFKGKYDGPLSPQRSEVERLEWFSRESLEEMIEQHPDEFGFDLKYMMRNYADEIFRY